MRSRGYVFTLNNWAQEEVDALLQTQGHKYLIFGKEVGSNGTPHLQGYICFKNKKSFKQVKELLGDRYHIEAQKGSFEQAIDYCKKEGDYTEVGNAPVSQKRKGELNAERWKRARTAAVEGRLEDVPDDIYVKYYRTLKVIAKDHMPRVPDADGTTGMWYWGDAGTGKSRTAREQYPEAYLKMANKWWDGYQGEDAVIIDDVDKNHACLGHHLKIWMDRYAFLGETKGGAIKIRPKVIIVTSQYRISEIWSDKETQDALYRRCLVKPFNDY